MLGKAKFVVKCGCPPWLVSFLIILLTVVGPALAQDAGGTDSSRASSTIDHTPPGTLNPKPLPPLANPNAPNLPAKELFARKLTPLPGSTRPIGSYANGCLAGAVTLPITGPTWQVMRLSRDRNWGTPRLVKFIERLGDNAKKVGWNGLLIGDMAQPRGGPMISGHSSHQIGLDVDIWFKPMPAHVLSREEREMEPAVNVVAPDGRDVDHKVWTPAYTEVVKTAAKDPSVTRIFVNAAIKKEMCSEAGTDRAWLAKVGPGGDILNIFTYGLPVRMMRSARDSRQCQQPMAAVMHSIRGSSRPFCTLRRRKCRPSPSRR